MGAGRSRQILTEFGRAACAAKDKLHTLPMMKIIDGKIKRFAVLLAAAAFVLSAGRAWASTESNDDGKADGLKIVVNPLEISDKTLNLTYEIRNDSQQEVWVCDCIDVHQWFDFEVYLSEDKKTLVIRRRLDVPSTIMWIMVPYGRYVQLLPGKKRTESISLDVPVNRLKKFQSGELRRELVYASQLSIEIGYYEGNLPEMIFKMLEESEMNYNRKTNKQEHPVTEFSGDIRSFNSNSERLKHRDNEILIPYTYQSSKGEKVLQTTVENLNIPYQERERGPSQKKITEVRNRDGVYSKSKEKTDRILYGIPPDLTSCTRVEISYEPSMLEYFFPFENQQRLLSPEEIDYLRSKQQVVIEDPKDIKALADEIDKGRGTVTDTFRERSRANVICYRNDKRLFSFRIYNDKSIFTDEPRRFTYQYEIESLISLTPQIAQLESRIRCAANLRNQWYRFRIYRIRGAKRLKNPSLRNQIIYPTPSQWCDDIQTYSIYASDDWCKEFHVCPSTGEGKNHYAMNPNCKPNSPGDMVLLFETKAGWNQHGGPELFTFDNHDPKGGCVLLNDGTVKFIRTQEELQALRWK